jgi:hypothetical protein
VAASSGQVSAVCSGPTSGDLTAQRRPTARPPGARRRAPAPRRIGPRRTTRCGAAPAGGAAHPVEIRRLRAHKAAMPAASRRWPRRGSKHRIDCRSTSPRHHVVTAPRRVARSPARRSASRWDATARIDPRWLGRVRICTPGLRGGPGPCLGNVRQGKGEALPALGGDHDGADYAKPPITAQNVRKRRNASDSSPIHRNRRICGVRRSLADGRSGVGGALTLGSRRGPSTQVLFR